MTMKSLADPSENAAIAARIERLTAGAERAWGKMEAAQMLAHLQAPLRVAYGELRLKRTLVGLLFGSIAKKTLTSPTPWKRDLPTDKAFLVQDERNFAEERQLLLDLVRRYAADGPRAVTRHPFFGSLTPEEWGVLMWKHLDHHLTQFGA